VVALAALALFALLRLDPLRDLRPAQTVRNVAAAAAYDMAWMLARLEPTAAQRKLSPELRVVAGALAAPGRGSAPAGGVPGRRGSARAT
jgi:hypothetical protein